MEQCVSEYVFPAVFSMVDNDIYDIIFPDLCATLKNVDGTDLYDLLKNAECFLEECLEERIDNDASIPGARSLGDVELGPSQFANYITASVEENKENRGIFLSYETRLILAMLSRQVGMSKNIEEAYNIIATLVNIEGDPLPTFKEFQKVALCK